MSAIVKRWGIKAIQHLENAKEYNEDLAKISKVNPFDIDDELSSTNNLLDDKSLQNLYTYAANKAKTDTIERRYVSGYKCTPETALQEFEIARNEYCNHKGKPVSGNVAFHIVQSFSPDTELSDEEIHQCAIELVEKLGGQYQAIICSHINPVEDEDGNIHGKCKHNHIILNAYPIDFHCNKYHSCKDELRQLRKYNDEILRNHNQNPLPLRNNISEELPEPVNELTSETTENSKQTDAESEKINREQSKTTEEHPNKKANTVYEKRQIAAKKSWKEDLRKTIDSIKNITDNWTDFEKKLNENNISLRQGKYITYITAEHRIRDYRLGEGSYSKKAIEDFWKNRSAIYENITTKPTEKPDSSDKKEKIYAHIFYTDKRLSTKYKIRKYDKYGRKRSNIELIFILAKTILSNDTNKYSQKIKVSKDKYLQGMMDSISLANVENINTAESLKKKLAQTGAEISKLKNIINKNETAQKNMLCLDEIINNYKKIIKSNPDLFILADDDIHIRELSPEEYTLEKDKIEEYNNLKHQLHYYKIHNNTDIADYEKRSEKIKEDYDNYKRRKAQLSKRYADLKRIEENFKYADEVINECAASQDILRQNRTEDINIL